MSKEVMKEIGEQFQKELDDLARSDRRLPKWKDHLRDFRAKHPEMGPREVMKKAGFTFRMNRGRQVSKIVKSMFKRVMEEVLKEDESVNTS